MIFGNGCWLQKEGCECFAPQQVYFVKKEDKKVTILTPTARISHRGDTLGGINLTLEITSPAPEVLRVRTYHHAGVKNKGPEFELSLGEETLDVTENDEEICIKSGSLSLVIIKETFSMTYLRDGEVITKSSGRDLGFMKTDWKGFAYDKGGDAYMRQELSLSVGEMVYGMGERFTAFAKNGQSVDIWNEDGGTSTYQSYKNVPFYITNKGYGVFVNHPEKVSFEIGTEHVSKAEFSVPGECLDYFLINGPSMKDVLVRYTDLTGKPSLPPQWTFGLWLSTSFTTNYDEETVMSFIDGMEERGIPLQVFHFDCFWMKEYEWCNFEWDKDMFPDPEGMLKRLHDKGLEICVWINSYIGQQSKLFDIGKEKGYFIKNLDGSVFQADLWQPGMAIVDFTNPEACSWYKGLLKNLFDMGVNNIKTDFGERIPTKCQYYNGMDPIKMHNYYTYLYNKVIFEALEEYYGKDKACLFARSATVGGQKFPVHWGGDCYADYSAMSETLHGGLSLCSSGFGFFSHDMGGFEATAPADIYKRWCAFGCLSTHSRLHGSTSYRVPWAYDDEACDVLRHYVNLKGKLMPYLWAQANKTHITGIPMMRSMIVAFTDETACKYLDQQYMLGDNLCIVPVMNAAGTAEFYLPDCGTWTDIQSGETYEGGRYYTKTCDYFQTPVLARQNSIVIYGNFDMDVVYDYLEGAEVVVYGLEDGKTAEAVVYDSESNKITDIKAVRNGKEITVSYDATDKNFKVTAEGKTVEAKAGTTSATITL